MTQVNVIMFLFFDDASFLNSMGSSSAVMVQVVGSSRGHIVRHMNNTYMNSTVSGYLGNISWRTDDGCKVLTDIRRQATHSLYNDDSPYTVCRGIFSKKKMAAGETR